VASAQPDGRINALVAAGLTSLYVINKMPDAFTTALNDTSSDARKFFCIGTLK
jgi:hypothetical protein